jgi:hypothetical protein
MTTGKLSATSRSRRSMPREASHCGRPNALLRFGWLRHVRTCFSSTISSSDLTRRVARALCPARPLASIF